MASHESTRRTLLVTGANGFVGRALCEQARAVGWRVRAALREGGASHSADETVSIGDIHGETDWGQALDDCWGVIHLAARAHSKQGTGYETYRAVNVDGTLRLARMAAEAGVRRFVFMSSVKVLGERTLNRPFTDANLPMPESFYARSKLEAEDLLFELGEHTGMAVTALRPPLVYGPGAKASFGSLMAVVERGWPVPLGKVATRRSLCYLGNLVDAVLRALDHPATFGRRFLVADTETLPLPEVVRALGDALGRPARLLPVPGIVLKGLGTAMGRGETVRRLIEPLEVDATGLRMAMDWSPPFTAEMGLTLTGRQYGQNNFLARRKSLG